MSRRESPVFHLVLFTSLFVPIACLPYIPIRRHLIGLRQSIHTLSSHTVALQHELNTTLLQTRLRKEETIKLADRMHALQEQLNVAAKQAAEAQSARLSLEQTFSRRLEATAEWTARTESARIKAERELKGQLEALKRRIERDRLPLQDISSSLAEIASFIEEVEIQHGWSQTIPRDRGVDRLRQLALKLHTMAQTQPNDPS